MLAEIAAAASGAAWQAAPVIDRKKIGGESRVARSPIDGRDIGRVVDATTANAQAAMRAAAAGFATWAATPVEARAAMLERAADAIAAARAGFIALAAGGGRQDPRRRRRGNPRGRRFLPLLPPPRRAVL